MGPMTPQCWKPHGTVGRKRSPKHSKRHHSWPIECGNLFRNRLTGFDPATTSGAKNPGTVPVNIGATNRYYNVIGNVSEPRGIPPITPTPRPTPPPAVLGTRTIRSTCWAGRINGEGLSATPASERPRYPQRFECRLDPDALGELGRGEHHERQFHERHNRNPLGQARRSSPYLSGVFEPESDVPREFLSFLGPFLVAISRRNLARLSRRPGRMWQRRHRQHGRPANHNPAANCYLNVMGGKQTAPAGWLTFNANTCYGSSGGGTHPSHCCHPGLGQPEPGDGDDHQSVGPGV